MGKTKTVYTLGAAAMLHYTNNTFMRGPQVWMHLCYKLESLEQQQRVPWTTAALLAVAAFCGQNYVHTWGFAGGASSLMGFDLFMPLADMLSELFSASEDLERWNDLENLTVAAAGLNHRYFLLPNLVLCPLEHTAPMSTGTTLCFSHTEWNNYSFKTVS